ncbi:MAG: CPBP family intramembrane metalloprotease [Chloroflexota bacterium]|nr:CPBP family intramembrane metalloprotease [Chloroflexota bacterium]
MRLTILPVAVALLFVVAYVLLYILFLNVAGRTNDADWDLFATYKFLGHLYVERYDRTTVVIVGYLLVGLWPMFGEELFYRGFVFKGLAYHVSPIMAAIASSSLFGLRHAFQLAYLLPAYPLVSGVAYFVWAAGFGLLWSWLYYRSGSLWPCIVTHSVNLLLAPVVFVLLGA